MRPEPAPRCGPDEWVRGVGGGGIPDGSSGVTCFATIRFARIHTIYVKDSLIRCQRENPPPGPSSHHIVRDSNVRSTSAAWRTGMNRHPYFRLRSGRRGVITTIIELF